MMLLVTLAVFALDRWSKHWATHTLRFLPGGMKPLWPGVVRLFYAENTGVSFSLLSGQRAALIVAQSALSLALAAWVFFGKRLSRFQRACGCLMLGGALGNLFDRLVRGAVVDMIDFEFVRFAVFNVADMALCVGVALLAVSLFFPSAKEPEKAA